MAYRRCYNLVPVGQNNAQATAMQVLDSAAIPRFLLRSTPEYIVRVCTSM